MQVLSRKDGEVIIVDRWGGHIADRWGHIVETFQMGLFLWFDFGAEQINNCMVYKTAKRKILDYSINTDSKYWTV